MPTFIDPVDEVQVPFPSNQHFSFDEMTLTHSRVWRLQFAWNMAGPPVGVLGPYNLRMYYTDDLLTATEADAAHRPQDVATASAFAVDKTIYIAYHKITAANTWQIRLNTFSMTTGLWGTEISGGPTIVEGIVSLHMVVRGGIRYILYAYPEGGVNKVGWIKYDSGWSATTQVSASETGQYRNPDGVYLDGNIIHLFFKSGGTWPDTDLNLYHRALDASEALGTTQFVCRLARRYRGMAMSPPVTFEGKIMFGYARDTNVVSTDVYNPGYDHVPALMIGDPAGVSEPTWSTVDVSTNLCDHNAIAESSGSMPVSVAVTPFLGPKLYVFWVTRQYIYVEMNRVMQSWRMQSDPTWNESVFYAPTEPTNIYLDDWVHNPDVITLEWGGVLFIIVDRVNASFTVVEGNEYSQTEIPPQPSFPVEGENRAMLLLDLSEARATLPDYD